MYKSNLENKDSAPNEYLNFIQTTIVKQAKKFRDKQTKYTISFHEKCEKYTSL